MGKSSKKSASKVEKASIVAAPSKPLKKGKREAEVPIEKEVVSAKQQKVENKIEVIIKNVEDDTSSASEQETKSPDRSISVRPTLRPTKLTCLAVEITTFTGNNRRLVAVLKEMKEGLEAVTNKVQYLTAKVKVNNYPTSDGMSYLEAKHLLLLNYCQLLVYYLLSKAKGLSIQGHPVVQSLVEIRLFLEKIRPVDKKLQYQINKLTRTAAPTTTEEPVLTKTEGKSHKTEDLLKYRPNPDLLLIKENPKSESTGVYRAPKFAPVSMEDGDKVSKQERNALRKEKMGLRQAKQSPYLRDIMNEMDGRPEEVTETVGVVESREMTRYTERMAERSRQEEELFNRVPLAKEEKKRMKHMKKSRNGLLGLTESFYDEIKALPIESSEQPEESTSFHGSRSGNKFNKCKRKH